MNDRLIKLWSDPRRIPILIGVVAFNAGCGLGYFLGRRRKQEDLKQEDIDYLTNRLKEISESENVFKMEDFVTPNQFSGVTIDDVTISSSPNILVQRSIFESNSNTNPGWNQEVEEAKRTAEEPYVISKDEFYNSENGYHQRTYTFYGGDEILTDEEDTPIYDYIKNTGELLFGHGSGDPTVVYIRNDKEKEEYEVNFEEGHYAVIVMGLDLEEQENEKDLRHSKLKRLRQE